MTRSLRFPATLIVIMLASMRWGVAEPVMPAGDTILRHDLQVLADHGILNGPLTSWPLSWGPVLSEIRDMELSADLPPAAAASLARVRDRASWETRLESPTFSTSIGGAESPMRIRSFQNTPRESAEVSAGVSYTGDVVSFNLKGQAVDQASGSGEVRLDGSMLGFAFGNYSLVLSSLDRWWGPGWDGSLILSNNARPIPAVSFDRNFTDPFESKWLSWLGPWDLSVMMGELESLREISNALFFGLRFNFKPISSLEIGLSRTAQWCGDGRPCDTETLGNLLIGRDNRGDEGIASTGSNEPGNQMAGVDLRWSPRFFGRPVALYGQFIGEDEAGGFPSRYLGQFGIETSGIWRDWSWRWFGEFAGTTCQFHESSKIFNCAYNHSIYRTGYRYRGRSIGHGTDNDAELVSTGLFLINGEGSHWRLLLRTGELNAGGPPDARNTVSSIPRDLNSIDLSYSHAFRYGVVEAGIGYQGLDPMPGGDDEDYRFHLQWRSAY